MIEVKRAVAAIHVAKEIFFRYLGKITESFLILELEGKNTVGLRIDGVSHRRKYGRCQKRDDLSRHVDGVGLALSFGKLFTDQRVRAIAFLATENAACYVKIIGVQI